MPVNLPEMINGCACGLKTKNILSDMVMIGMIDVKSEEFNDSSVEFNDSSVDFNRIIHQNAQVRRFTTIAPQLSFQE